MFFVWFVAFSAAVAFLAYLIGEAKGGKARGNGCSEGAAVKQQEFASLIHHRHRDQDKPEHQQRVLNSIAEALENKPTYSE